MTGLGSEIQQGALRDRRNDFYETPPEAVHALLKVETLPRVIWEPAAGRGAIVNVLRSYGHEVIASDLVDYGEPLQYTRRDFLMEIRTPEGCECIVTNPPYKLANQFVRHGLRRCSKVVMLLRLAFLEGTSRNDLIDGMLARVWVFRNRLPMMHREAWTGPRSTSRLAFAWFVFEREHTGPAQLDRVTWESV